MSALAAFFAGLPGRFVLILVALTALAGAAAWIDQAGHARGIADEKAAAAKAAAKVSRAVEAAKPVIAAAVTAQQNEARVIVVTAQKEIADAKDLDALWVAYDRAARRLCDNACAGADRAARFETDDGVPGRPAADA